MTQIVFHTHKTRLISRFTTVVILCIMILMSRPNQLSANSLIRDAEIENTLQMIARPIFRAADLDETDIKVLIINSNYVNAFIVDNNRVFFTTSLLTQLKNSGMFQAILAHEVAHITSGHILRTKLNMDSTEWQSNLGSIIGILIASTLSVDAGLAISLGTNIATQNKYFSNSREMENIADTIGVNLLDKAKINPSYALKTMEIFENFEKLSSLDEHHYIRTHPLSSKRMANIKASIKHLEPKEYFFNDHLNYRYQRILAKVKAFSNNPEKTLREIDQSSTNEITLIKKAIASHLKPDPEAALEAINRLIIMKPKDPYFIELLGQMHLETGHPQKAISAFSKALKIMPNEPSFLIWSAISHLALETSENNTIALKLLKNASKSDKINPRLLRHLAIAYARNGQPGKAALTTSEYYIILGRFKAARMQANQALKTLKPYSFEWRKAQDIIKISSKLGENN